MTPDEELQLLRADWAALVAQVSGGEGANLRRDEKHPNSSRELLQQALEALMAGPDVDPIFAGETEEALRAALAAPQGEAVAWKNAAIRLGEELSSVGPDGYYEMTAEHWLDWALTVAMMNTPPAAPSVPASQWIACSEQLPDADIEVLAFADEAMYLAMYEPDGRWTTDHCEMLHRVTHWMDLPGEPSGEEKER